MNMHFMCLDVPRTVFIAPLTVGAADNSVPRGKWAEVSLVILLMAGTQNSSPAESFASTSADSKSGLWSKIQKFQKGIPIGCFKNLLKNTK